jgi:hypothetical protein
MPIQASGRCFKVLYAIFISFFTAFWLEMCMDITYWPLNPGPVVTNALRKNETVIPAQAGIQEMRGTMNAHPGFRPAPE